MPKISVIMPIYNSARTLKRCLNAIARQTFANYELLLCDDGSTDESLQICRTAASTDPRLSVCPLPHGGVSAARNSGLKRASGTYVAFVDSDDEPDPDWLSALWQNARQGGLSVCGYTVRDLEGNVLYGTENTDLYAKVTPAEFMDDLFSNRLMYQGYIWNKLFCRKTIESSGPLRFDERIHYNEDRLFLFWYLLSCTGVNYSGVSNYNYFKRPPSQTFSSEMLTELDAFEVMIKELRRLGNDNALFWAEADLTRAKAEIHHLTHHNKEAISWQNYL